MIECDFIGTFDLNEASGAMVKQMNSSAEMNVSEAVTRRRPLSSGVALAYFYRVPTRRVDGEQRQLKAGQNGSDRVGQL